MTCREFADVLADYLSGDMPAPTRRVFEEHLAICENCQKYLRSYEETVKLGRRAFDHDGPVPDEVPDDLVKAVLAARGRARSR